MVGMQVGQKESGQIRRRQSRRTIPLGGLFGPAHDSRARIEEVRLPARHNRNCRAGTLRVRYRRAGTENDHLSRLGRKQVSWDARERAQYENSLAVHPSQAVEYRISRLAGDLRRLPQLATSTRTAVSTGIVDPGRWR